MLIHNKTIITDVKNNNTLSYDDVSIDNIAKGDIVSFKCESSEHQHTAEITGQVTRIEHIISKEYMANVVKHIHNIYVY